MENMIDNMMKCIMDYQLSKKIIEDRMKIYKKAREEYKTQLGV